MNRKKRNIYIVVSVAVLVAVAAFSLYWFYYRKVQLEKIAQEQRIAALEEEMRTREEIRQRREQEIEQRREEQSAEIVDFHIAYIDLRNEYVMALQNISNQFDSRAESMGQIKKLTLERIEASQQFSQSFEGMDMPEALTIFHDQKMAFLDHDVETWSVVYDYYNSGQFSTYDTEQIDTRHTLNMQLFREAEEALQRVYERYELEDLWEDYNTVF